MEIELELERVTRQQATITIDVNDYAEPEINSANMHGTTLVIDFESAQIEITDLIDEADWQDLGEPDTIELTGSNY